MKTLITKTVLGAVGVALVAIALQVSPAAADHRHVDRRDHGYGLPIARHDHGYGKRAYGRSGEVVHKHSGYGRHIHVSPYADHGDGRRSARRGYDRKHHDRKRHGRADYSHQRHEHKHDHKHSRGVSQNDDHQHKSKTKKLLKKKKVLTLFKKFRKH